MHIKQESQYLNEDWWNWSVELDAPPQEIEKVKYVEYTLDPTFPQPVRRVHDPGSHFKLSTKGWGGFTIYANVIFKDGTQKRLEHELELDYPDGTQTER